MSGPDPNLQAALRLISETFLADGEARSLLSPTMTGKPKPDRYVNRVKIIMLMLDGIDEDWLREQIEEANRYESVGFLFAPPMEYQKKTQETPDVKDLARKLLNLKKLRTEHLERIAGS